MKSKVGVIVLLPVLMASLTIEAQPTIDDFSLEKNDPNSARASRLLYSPRSGASRVHDVDMHSILRKLRENQQQNQAQQLTQKPDVKENTNSVNGGQLETQQEESIRGTQIIEEEPRSVKIHTLSKEACHAHHLQKCGAAVVDGFAAPGLTMERKCRIREHFLTCMIKMKRRPCRSRSRFMELDEETLRQFRQKILSLLWTARGCVLGIEVP